MTPLHSCPTLTLDEVIGVTLESFEQLLSSHFKEGGVELVPLSPRGTCDYCKSSDLLYFIFPFFLLVMFISGCHSHLMCTSSEGGSTADALVPLYSRSLHILIARANTKCVPWQYQRGHGLLLFTSKGQYKFLEWFWHTEWTFQHLNFHIQCLV